MFCCLIQIEENRIFIIVRERATKHPFSSEQRFDLVELMSGNWHWQRISPEVIQRVSRGIGSVKGKISRSAVHLHSMATRSSTITRRNVNRTDPMLYDLADSSFAAPNHAPVPSKVPEQRITLHPTTTSSCWASGGTERSDSSRRYCRISVMAARKFARHSSRVLPCPLAPGTSAQYATCHSPSRSMTAVNSFRMSAFYSPIKAELRLSGNPTVHIQRRVSIPSTTANQ